MRQEAMRPPQYRPPQYRAQPAQLSACWCGKETKAAFIASLTQKNSGEILSTFITKDNQRLYKFQKECVEFGIKNLGRVIIADEMGLGKTVESLALAYCFREKWPLLIICPASLVTCQLTASSVSLYLPVYGFSCQATPNKHARRDAQPQILLRALAHLNFRFVCAAAGSSSGPILVRV